MWQPLSGVLLQQLYHHQGPIRAMRLSTDGTADHTAASIACRLCRGGAGLWLHSCSDDKTVKLEQRQVAPAHDAAVLVLDECDGFVYSASRSGALLCHEAKSGQLVQQRTFEFGVRSVAVQTVQHCRPQTVSRTVAVQTVK